MKRKFFFCHIGHNRSERSDFQNQKLEKRSFITFINGTFKKVELFYFIKQNFSYSNEESKFLLAFHVKLKDYIYMCEYFYKSIIRVRMCL